jgi:hypothetical protein
MGLVIDFMWERGDEERSQDWNPLTISGQLVGLWNHSSKA